MCNFFLNATRTISLPNSHNVFPGSSAFQNKLPITFHAEIDGSFGPPGPLPRRDTLIYMIYGAAVNPLDYICSKGLQRTYLRTSARVPAPCAFTGECTMDWGSRERYV